MKPAYDQYRASIERAEQHGGIVYVEKDLHDPYSHLVTDHGLLIKRNSNTRSLGNVGRLVLEYTHRLRQRTEALFLGPGTGKECYEARNLVEEGGRDIVINTVTLTPVAPDIALWDSSRTELLQTKPFIDRQIIGDLVHMELPEQVRADWVYDHFGPLFHGSAKTRSNPLERTTMPYRTMLEKILASSSPTACIVQERLCEKDHAQIWKEIMGNKDILMQSWRSSVLIRNGRLAVPKQKKVGTFSHPLEFDHELTKVLRKIQKTLAS